VGPLAHSLYGEGCPENVLQYSLGPQIVQSSSQQKSPWSHGLVFPLCSVLQKPGCALTVGGGGPAAALALALWAPPLQPQHIWSAMKSLSS